MSRFSFFGWFWALLIAAASGAFYSVRIFGGSPFIGACYAIVIIGLLLAFEQDLLLPKLRLRLMRLPTAIYFICTLVINIATVALGSIIVGTTFWYFGITGSWVTSAIPPRGVTFYAICVSGLMVFVLRMRDLIGPEVFFSLLVSRYRRPRSENRVFLLIDLVGSTRYAEEHGDLRAQKYLGEFFKTVALSVRQFGGAVDDYIGDAALITWRFEKGVRNAACIRCVLHIFETLKSNEAFWLHEFGQLPQLRAALHGGPIVVAEIGLDHRKITFFGDTVNTTARIEGLARDLSKRFLISDSLLGQVSKVDMIKIEPLGSFAVRGKGQSLAVTAIESALSRAT